MVNKVIIVGNLGRDPEVRNTPSGQTLAKFSVATTRKWGRGDERQEETEWHNIVCWGRDAEIAGQYLSKGRQVYLEGRLKTDSWEDRETGQKRYRTEIVCERFQMLGGRGDSGGGGGYGAQRPAEPSGPSGGYGADADADDDIPF